MKDIKEFLHQVHLFDNLSDAQLEYILPLIKEVSCLKGSFLIKEGEVSDILYIIKKGEVEILKLDLGAGGYNNIAILPEKSIVGELASISNKPRYASVRAIKDTTVLALPINSIYSLFNEKNYNDMAAHIESITQEMYNSMEKARIFPIIIKNLTVYLSEKLQTTNTKYISTSQDSITDKLTNLYNRRHFDIEVHKAILKAHTELIPLSLLMIDIDHFKVINDTYGHQTGDLILHDVALRFKKILRAEDFISRYGGEEFIVILNVPLDMAKLVANKIKDSIESMKFQISVPPYTIQCTISIGISFLRMNDNLNSLLARADKSLYQAKEAGRNLVISEDT